ncbi:endolytic transglycosylase MltG [Sediminibacterium sp.]|uniref:endolytic transglycosylase MltG n=1 Tax=Sediminibacterium sp. TaxID=1917865 RepID=UPI0025EE7C6A|nr:endolytic transglycosylase MltG [Sediminibacterium sp.]
MKKPLVIVAIAMLFIAFVLYWLFALSATAFDEKSRMVTIEKNNTQKSAVLKVFENAGILKYNELLGIAGAPFNIWDKMKPGRYEIKKGQSIIDIVRMLKNGRLAEVKLVINRVRTKAELAKLISKQFMTDSIMVMEYLSSNDSLTVIGSDTTLLFTKIIPDTYNYFADASMQTILQKLSAGSNNFWEKNNRLQKAAALKMTPEQVYILASIVDEETNYDADKYKIASVYINRLKKQMPLQACPTIKYAMNDFTITRIYEKYLTNPSPYNTYKVKGLPPGPICTPSPKTIDIVLDAPQTDYIYFVAKSDFSGYHHFSNNYEEHNAKAKEYQKKLDEYMLRKRAEKP